MDSKKQPNTTKELMTNSKKSWFWIRLAITAVVVFFLWWFIAPVYVGIISSFILWIMDLIGFYVNKAPKPTDAIMSPVIPFLILMIATWGTKLLILKNKPNWKLLAWTFGVSCFLFAVSMFGQFVAVYMDTTNSNSDFLVFLGGFLIATGPVLIPIVAWLALSHKELRDTFLRA